MCRLFISPGINRDQYPYHIRSHTHMDIYSVYVYICLYLHIMIFVLSHVTRNTSNPSIVFVLWSCVSVRSYLVCL